MNQSEETIAPPPADHPEPPTNGKEGYEKRKTPYQNLQELIGHEITQIHTILTKYYEEYGNQYYLVDQPKDQEHKDLFKWTIVKNGDSNAVEVFFKAKGQAKSDTQAAQANTNASTPTIQAKLVQTDQGQSAEIYTYDEVGAPPAGPTPAKPPNQ